MKPMTRLRWIKARLWWWWSFRRPNWFRNHFIKREYIVLTHDGTASTMRAVDACNTLQDSDHPSDFTVTAVWMTPHQFDAMPDFQGW